MIALLAVSWLVWHFVGGEPTPAGSFRSQADCLRAAKKAAFAIERESLYEDDAPRQYHRAEEIRTPFGPLGWQNRMWSWNFPSKGAWGPHPDGSGVTWLWSAGIPYYERAERFECWPADVDAKKVLSGQIRR